MIYLLQYYINQNLKKKNLKPSQINAGIFFFGRQWFFGGRFRLIFVFISLDFFFFSFNVPVFLPLFCRSSFGIGLIVRYLMGVWFSFDKHLMNWFEIEHNFFNELLVLFYGKIAYHITLLLIWLLLNLTMKLFSILIELLMLVLKMILLAGF